MFTKYIISANDIFSDKDVYYSENSDYSYGSNPGLLYSGRYDTRRSKAKLFDTVNKAEIAIEMLIKDVLHENRDVDDYNVVFSIETIYTKK